MQHSELIKKLGRGGFATVYRARDTQMGREVALKVISGNLAREAAFVERFRQEASSAANLYHPNIVTVFDFGDSGDALYLAMRLIQGPTLAHLLEERGRLPLAEALPILEQLAQALDYLHVRQLVHRDLKPANVMLEGEAPLYQVTLTDFGLVRSLEASTYLTKTESSLGTPAYMAPEQADSKQWGEITPLTDVYALGVLVYRLLLGQPPFEGDLPTVLYAHAYEPPAIPLEQATELGDDLAEILLKALAKPPAERYPRASALVDALQQVVHEQERQAAEQVELVHLLEQAQAARERNDWVAVQSYCVEMMKLDPMHPTMIELMSEAAAGLRQASAEEVARRKRQERYEAGEQALAEGDWPAAIEAFAAVVAENPDFREVQARLAQARDELQRAEWYDEAIAQAEAGRWTEACQTWLQLLPGRLNYREGDAAARLLVAVEGLLALFRQQQHDLEQVRKALPLYDQLTDALYRRDWPETIALAEQLLALAPDVAWSPGWLDDARQRVATVEAAAERRVVAPSSGDTMIWEKDGKEMVRVPAGEFLYGDKKEKKTLPKFWIDKTPVTNAEYARFVADTKHEPPGHWQGKTPPKDIAAHPVVYVSWDDANAYAQWAGKRLPTEEEWEKAARGIDGRKYPWGEESPTAELCNFGENEGGATPVGKYSPQGDSPYGCVDMSGNVWEWTATDYDQSTKVLRGSSWSSSGEAVRAASRGHDLPDFRYVTIGFRCVVVAPGKGNSE